MIKDLGDMFGVLEKFDITMEQFMLPYILFLDQREYGEGPLPCGGHPVAYIYRYSENIRAWPRASIQDLVDKGLLKDYNEDEGVYPDHLEVTDKFAEAVFATRSDFERFWDTYPAFANSSDMEATDMEATNAEANNAEAANTEAANTEAANMESPDDSHSDPVPLKASVKAQVRDLFEEKVQTNREFEELMEALRWAKRQNLARMPIEEFLSSEYWRQLREMMGDPSAPQVPA